jgi:hypothetical protein
MPILEKNTRLVRPAGCRYASGSTQESILMAMTTAILAFHREFGRPCVQERTIIETMGVTGGWSVTIVEEPEDEK